MPVGEQRMATLIPKDAVVMGGRQPIIFVIRKSTSGDLVKQIPVVLGVMDGDFIEVPNGSVQANDLVVIRGNERLKDGQAVAKTIVSGPKPKKAATERTSDAASPAGQRK